MSLNNSPHASTHASSLSPPPRYLTAAYYRPFESGVVAFDDDYPMPFPNPYDVPDERGLLENIVQQAISAQQAFDRGERLAVQERLAEITRVLRDLGLGKGVLGLDGALPPLVDDALPVPLAVPAPLDAASGAKRAAEGDDGPKKALKLTPPREMDASAVANIPNMSMPNVPANIPNIPANMPIPPNMAPNMARPMALMHAHSYPLHAPHVSSPLAALPYETMAIPEPVFEPDPFHVFPSYHVSRPPTPHSPRSDDDSDDSDEGRHVKQEHPHVSLSRVRHTPPKPRIARPGDLTPDMPSIAHSANVLPPELKAEVDRVFFQFLNKICSNLDATDSKGEAIHQTLMAKKMARLDELPDFRPFKFRIQAFTNGFLEELAAEGYPDEVIPMKKIKSYLWNQPYISRFNEDGKKAKSKGNHIWNIDARKLDNAGPVHWTFREFKRKIAGTPPGIAYHGHLWQWAPHVWDPQVSRANITATFSSTALPPWLSWNDNVLTGTPGPDATNTDITVHAKVLSDPDEQVLSHTFHLTIAPSAVDPAFVKSRRPSLAHDVRRNASDTAVTREGMRTRAGSTSSNPSDNHQVMQVLANAVSRVTHAAHAAQTHCGTSMSDVDQAALLAKQQQVLGATAQAVADEVRAGPHPDSQGTASVLVAAAHSVVVGAAQLVATDRVTQATRNAADPHAMVPAQAPISVTEVSVATQSAVAHAVALNGPMASDVEVMMTANALIQQQQIASTTEALEATQVTHLLGGPAPGSVSPQIGDHRSRSMSSLANPVMPMNVGLVTGLGPGLDGMSVVPPMHGMTGLVANGMQ